MDPIGALLRVPLIYLQAELPVVGPGLDPDPVDHSPVGPAEHQRPGLGVLCQTEAPLVDQVVVEPAELGEVLERGLAALRPVGDVVALHEAGLPTAGEHAPLVPAPKRPGHCGGDLASLAP